MFILPTVHCMQLRIDPEVAIDCLLYSRVLFYLPSTADAVGSIKRKMPSSMRKKCGFRSSCAYARSHKGICSPSKQSIVSNDSGSGSEYLRCPHMPEDMFSHGAAQLMSNASCAYAKNKSLGQYAPPCALVRLFSVCRYI